jgi:NitT/TauT family transport system permease protein
MQALPWIVILCLWQLVSALSIVVKESTGDPLSTLREVVRLCGHYGISDIGITARTALYGYVLGIAAAVVSAAILVPFKFVMLVLDPFLAIINALPRVSIAPVLIVCFGIGVKTGVVYVFSIVFLMVFLNLYAGAKTVDSTLIANVVALGGNRRALIRQVYLPSAAGWLVTSLKTAAAWALLSAALAEYLEGNGGLGALIVQGGSLADPNLVSAAATVIALMAVITNLVLGHFERRLSRWRRI